MVLSSQSPKETRSSFEYLKKQTKQQVKNTRVVGEEIGEGAYLDWAKRLKKVDSLAENERYGIN